jgi:hypothetical protein
MKKTGKTGILLLLEGVLSICFAFFMFYIAKSQSSLELLYIPFDWIGNVLRWLSLGSSIGNVIALICYITLSTTPIIYLLAIRRKAGFQKVDILLSVLSLYLFLMLYEFINQGLMLNHVPQMMNDASALPVVKLALAIIFYSLFLGYLMIRMLATLAKDNIDDRMQFLCQGLQKILLAVSIFYIFFIGYFVTFQLLSNLNNYAVKTSPISTYPIQIALPNSVALDQLMAFLTYLLQCLPIVYSILILLKGNILLKIMTSHHMEEDEFIAAAQLSNISKKAVYVTVFSNLTLNLIQLLLSKHLSDTSFHLEIVFSPLIIAFAAMILSGYFKETKELHEDNEMII